MPTTTTSFRNIVINGRFRTRIGGTIFTKRGDRSVAIRRGSSLTFVAVTNAMVLDTVVYPMSDADIAPVEAVPAPAPSADVTVTLTRAEAEMLRWLATQYAFPAAADEVKPQTSASSRIAAATLAKGVLDRALKAQ